MKIEKETILFWTFLFAAMLILGAVVVYGIRPADDTDLDKWHRSGLTLFIDHGTGVNYLMDGNGNLIIRRDCDGKPVVTPKR